MIWRVLLFWLLGTVADSACTYHYDYRGSTLALTGDNGLVTDRAEDALYGLTTYRYGRNDTPFLFNGRYGVQTDPNGLLYMRGRYYNPCICRFLGADPSGFHGGLNFDAYANGNPVSDLDPLGLNAAATGDSASGGLYTAPSSMDENGVYTANTTSLATGTAVVIIAVVTLSIITDTEPADPTILGNLAAVDETSAAEGALTTPGSVPLGFTRLELQEGSFVNRVYDSSGAPGTWQLFGQSFSPGSALPTDAASAITSRGLNPAINKAELGGVFRVNQSMTVYQGTALGGHAPELFIPSGLHQYITPVLQNVPIVP